MALVYIHIYKKKIFIPFYILVKLLLQHPDIDLSTQLLSLRNCGNNKIFFYFMIAFPVRSIDFIANWSSVLLNLLGWMWGGDNWREHHLQFRNTEQTTIENSWE